MEALTCSWASCSRSSATISCSPGSCRIGLVYRKDTNARGFWLVERMFGWKTFLPENFLEINGYFALTSYCNTIGQSNNAFSILGFSLAGKRRVHVLIFSSIGLLNRWLVCECVVTQIYGICSLWVIGSRQNQCKIQNTQDLNWKSWKTDAVVGLFSDLA